MPVLAKHIPALHDQLSYANVADPSHEGIPTGWKSSSYSPIDWSGTAARNRRFNNCPMLLQDGKVSLPKAPDLWTSPRWWNSGYFAAVLISPWHALVCAHYRRAVPAQANNLRFIGKSGTIYSPKVKSITQQISVPLGFTDLDVVEFQSPIDADDCPPNSRIADMLTAKPGQILHVQSPQSMTYKLTVDAIGWISDANGVKYVQTLGLSHVTDGVSENGLGDGKQLITFSGDSGSPAFIIDRYGQQAFVGLLYSQACIPMHGVKGQAACFEVLEGLCKERGHTLTKVDVSPWNADVNRDGKVDGADQAMVLASWGQGSGPADVNADGIVDAKDLSAVLAGWSAHP